MTGEGLKRVLLLAMVVCSVLICGEVASAQKATANLWTGGYLEELYPRNSHEQFFLSFGNDGESNITFPAGSTVASASWEGTVDVESCTSRLSFDDTADVIADYPEVRCELSDSSLELIAVEDFTMKPYREDFGASTASEEYGNRISAQLKATTGDTIGSIEFNTVADPENVISESDEDDNNARRTTYVGQLPPTDLEIVQTLSRPNPLYIGKGSFYQLIEIVNNGPHAARSVSASVPSLEGLQVAYADGKYLEADCQRVPDYGFRCTDDRIPAGDEVTLASFTYDLSDDIQPRTYFATASVASEQGDSEEGNNTMTLGATLRYPPVAPKMSRIPNVVVKVSKPVKPIKFTVSDEDAPVKELKVTAKSSNPKLLPSKEVTVIGTAENRTIRLSPLKNKTGSSRVTVIATDRDGMTASRAFIITVKR